MKKVVHALLLCAQFCFAPVELDVLAAISGEHKATITVSDENTPQEIREALNRVFDIESDGITVGQVCPVKYPTFLVGNSFLQDYMNFPLTKQDIITCIYKADKQILLMPLFYYSNLTVAFIGKLTNFYSICRDRDNNQTMTLEEYIGYIYEETQSIALYSMFYLRDNEYIKEMIHEISLHTDEIRLIHPEYEHILHKDPDRAERPNCQTIDTWPDADQNQVPCYTFSAKEMFDSLIFLIKKANKGGLDQYWYVDQLDYNYPITQDHLDGNTPPEPAYRKQPWFIVSTKEHQSPLYHGRLPQHVPNVPARRIAPQAVPQFLQQAELEPARQVLPQFQISHTQYIANLLQRFAQLICPNT